MDRVAVSGEAHPENLKLALARLPGHVLEASRLFRELTGFRAVSSFRSPADDPSRPLALTPPVHPLCAAMLHKKAEGAPCEEEWQAHLRTGLHTHSVQRHTCPLGLRCSCVPIYYGDALAGVAKCVVGPGTAERRFSRAVQLLELTVFKACQDFRMLDMSNQMDRLREQVVRLKTIRTSGGAVAKTRRSKTARRADPVDATNRRSLIDRTLDYIALHYLDPNLTLAAISREMGVSERHLTHFFARIVGQHMHAYVVQLRVQHACRLLLLTEESIKKVAPESGFSRVEVFRRAFRKYVGVAPAVYRQAFTPA